MSEDSNPPWPEIYELTPAEYAAAIESTLTTLGFTREDLARQAEGRDFDSPAAFMMWQTIKDR